MHMPLAGANSKPRVSVILCTFNRARLVQRAIASVLRQTYSQWELIIVDDGSTDGSERLLLRAAKADQRIIYIRHANRGLAESRNAGVAQASGEYVTFLDSDDELKTTHIKKRVAYMESRPSVDAMYGGLIPVGPRTKQFVPDVTKPNRKIHLSKCYVAGTLFLKRSVFLRSGGFRNITYGDDYYFIQRLKKRFRLVRTHWQTYIYHLEAEDRLCDLYETGGMDEILKFRKSRG